MHAGRGGKADRVGIVFRGGDGTDTQEQSHRGRYPLSHTAGLAKWGLVCVLARILTAHDWLPSGLLTDEVREVLAGVSGVAAVSVLSLVADRGMVRLREWQAGRSADREEVR